MSRVTYELTQFIALGAILLLAVVFYIWGQREKRNQDVPLAQNAEHVGGVAGE